MKTGHELTGLIKFLGRDDWKQHFKEVLGEHFGLATKKFDLEFDEIGDLLDDQWADDPVGLRFRGFPHPLRGSRREQSC
jgi:hypothetical protein